MSTQQPFVTPSFKEQAMHHSTGEVLREDDFLIASSIDHYSSITQAGRAPLSLVNSTQQFSHPKSDNTPLGGIERLAKVCQRHREVDRQIENHVREMAVAIARLVCEAQLSHLSLPRNYRASSACGDYFLAMYDKTGKVAAIFCDPNSAIMRWEPRARAISPQHMQALFTDLESGLVDEIADLVENMTARSQRAIQTSDSSLSPVFPAEETKSQAETSVSCTLEDLQITIAPVVSPANDASIHIAAPATLHRPRTLSELGRRPARGASTMERREKRNVSTSL